ncbi:hypothetical protein S40285_09473 [Stachybotrys chlorohalonatus IBT 40285]|uniref:DUF6594 domain-containing protein n=1 Tax=Stachybotrys chlorohalonatus (strain IBT 40285) TaxID=1283841 RepID=A0A084QXE0_STAC4|nr:hypothetical protein S40285_09473 [Stachybotrys chlorohalonata IBT 40285]
MAMDSTFTKEVNQTAELFRKFWPCVTDDNNLTLHGFRRFKTTHLLNLRFLEHDIAEVDRKIYQAGLSLGCEPSSRDRLGLRNGTHDPNVPVLEDTIKRDLILNIRDLLQKYDEGLMAFSSIMAMETVSLLDDGMQSSLRTDLTLYEKYNTRLIRADLGARSRIDPFQRWLHKRLRAFRYWRIANKQDDPESSTVSTQDYWHLAFKKQHQATLRIFISHHRWKDGEPTEEEALMMLNHGDYSASPVPAVFMFVPGMPVVVNQNTHQDLKLSMGLAILPCVTGQRPR